MQPSLIGLAVPNGHTRLCLFENTCEHSICDPTWASSWIMHQEVDATVVPHSGLVVVEKVRTPKFDYRLPNMSSALGSLLFPTKINACVLNTTYLEIFLPIPQPESSTPSCVRTQTVDSPRWLHHSWAFVYTENSHSKNVIL